MYFLTGWPRRLLCPLRSEEEPFYIQPSSQRFYFALLSETQLSVWFSRVSWNSDRSWNQLTKPKQKKTLAKMWSCAVFISNALQQRVITWPAALHVLLSAVNKHGEKLWCPHMSNSNYYFFFLFLTLMCWQRVPRTQISDGRWTRYTSLHVDVSFIT